MATTPLVQIERTEIDGVPVNTVRFDECVALRHWDGPIRELWGADGFRVVVNAAAWRGGAAVVEEIDKAVDPALVACGEHGIGGLEDKPMPGVRS